MDKKYRIRLKRLLWDYYAVDVRFKSFRCGQLWTFAKIANDGIVKNIGGQAYPSYESAFKSLRKEYDHITGFLNSNDIIFYTDSRGTVNTTFIPEFETLDELELKIKIEGREKIDAVKKK